MEGKEITISSCDYKPPFWEDDMKMEVWFAPFRNRDLNPLNYDNKMAFWKKNVEMYCNCTRLCYFNESQLRAFYMRNTMTPSCLITVLEDMLREGSIQYLDVFEKSQFQYASWSEWAVDSLIKHPLKWSYRKMKETLSPTTIEIDKSTYFVHVSYLKNMSEKVRQTVVEESRDILLTFDDVKDNYTKATGLEIDIRSVRLIVHFLNLNGRAKVIAEMKQCKNELIKFATDDKPVSPISETEIMVYVLMSKEKMLAKKLQNLERERETLTDEVKCFLKQKMRTMAKNSLRKQKELEKRINKMVSVLENIQILLYRVQDTESDSQILESYKVGADALKSKIQHGGLDLNNVDRAIGDVEQALDLHSDIQETLGQSVGPFQNEDELEEELAELLMDDEPPAPPKPPSPSRKIQGDIRFEDLPDVPKDLPNVSSSQDQTLKGYNI